MTDVSDAAELEIPGPSNALAMFEWRYDHDPDAPLILTSDGTARTYAQLAGRVALLADALETRGVERGHVVGLYLANEPAWIVALLACWRVRAVAACCASLSPTGEAARRFELANVTHVIAREAFGHGRETVIVDAEGQVAGPTQVAGTLEPRAGLISPADPAVLLFTSGTTGEPKAIWRPHAELANAPRVTAGAYARTSEFRLRAAPPDLPPAISFSPFGHASALGRLIFRIYVGRRLLIIPKFNMDAMEQVTRNYPIDTLHLTPAMIHELAFTERKISLRDLKYVNSGSAPLPLTTRDRFEDRYGVPVLQAYGATEGAITALEHYDDVIAGRRGPGSVGRIPKDMPHRIVDADGNDVKPGEIGELLGRLRTVEGSSPNPAVDADGWFHTGDLARIDEHGILFIAGRIKEMMIVGGFNVYPGEVEEALRKASQVHDVVVVPLPDARLGELPVAGVVWDQGIAAEQRDEVWKIIALATRSSIEPYKVPRQWFALDDIPRNANSKVDRAAALALALAAFDEQPVARA